MKFGVDLNFFNGVNLTGTDAASADAYNSAVSAQTPLEQIASASNGTPLETAGFATAGGSGIRIGVTSGDIAAFITALETVTDTTVLANPKIMAVNKQLGQVYIGTKIGYTSQTTQTQTSTTQEVEFLDTGTKLSFKPYIGDDGYIRMDIHPKDSSGTLKENDIPDESSTELATNIIVKDGQTIVVGGLFRDVMVASRSQIPILGDLPLIGVAFRGTNDTVTRQEVIVLLTPHIIDKPEDADSHNRVEDVQRKRQGAKKELQWTSRARLADDLYSQAAQLYVEGDSAGAIGKLDIALELRPSFLEALRLKERIITENNPDEVQMLERNILDSIDQKEAPNWQRR
jgi:type II secretory pathway component GspD/PulD (secretin)